MKETKKIKIIGGLFTLLVSMPIWFYLLYSILNEINANELMWFLFWVYIPVTIVAGVIGRFIDSDT